MSINVLEVTANGEQDVICSEMICCFWSLRHELSCSKCGIVLCVVWSIDKGTVIDPISLKIQILRRPVDVINHHKCEKLSTSTKMSPSRSPKPLHAWFVHSFFRVLEITSGKNYGIESHLGKETRISVWMAKWINLPSDSRSDTNFFEKELMSRHHVINHIFKVSTCFVVHGPSSVNKL